MILIKTPDAYFNEVGIIKTAGLHITPYGNNALIIGGKTALSVVGEQLFKSLESYHVNFLVKEFTGFVTMEEIQEYADYGREVKADVIIGVGGGKALDLAKAVGDNLDLKVVTIPTIASTCAAWSALSTVYNEDGSAKGALHQKYCPVLVLADTDIIANAPIKYLKAGIGDSIAKWYEYAPKLAETPEDIALRSSLQSAQLILDVIDEYGLVAIEEAASKNVTKAVKEMIDVIIFLAGLVGSAKDGKLVLNFVHAHSIDHSLTKIQEASDSLHGERVIFGLIVQLILEDKSDEEVEKLVAQINKLDLPVSLKQLGISNNLPEKITAIARGVDLKRVGLDRENEEKLIKKIEKAIIKADSIFQKMKI
ncbi:iron-containing alcohol dehydrogenase family protein [Pelosinus sp. sgz500959]|uniref:iron-containing alcohol dehydrogenase family protein n=1 Tax=Pelosinus sp. sgz500959 TaxID=3242472 RepID=UPI00366C1366